MGQANSAEEHKLVTSFEEVRRTLLKEEFADRMDKPLAYWALPNDRRLPLAFLGRSLGELLTYDRELAAQLHGKDRVHTYGSFYIADVAA